MGRRVGRGRFSNPVWGSPRLPGAPVGPIVCGSTNVHAVCPGAFLHSPLRRLDSTRFDQLRELLTRAGYTSEAVSAHLGLATMYDYMGRVVDAQVDAEPVESALAALARLFLDARALSHDVIDAQLGPEARPLLTEFGLLQVDPVRPDVGVSTVLLYPVEGLWIVSDRPHPPEQASVDPSTRPPNGPTHFADAVYPALTPSGKIFLGTIPRGRGGRYLEMCAGSGIGALVGAASGADEVWAVDITERSTDFAQFNAMLNGLDQVTALQGDLWEPVRGQRFDTIAAHPPYVPAPEPELIFRDGGEDGEQVTRAFLMGVHEHLAPGGVLQCTCMLSSRGGSDTPQRVRAMLGEGEEDYDVVVLTHGSMDLVSHLRDKLASGDPATVSQAAGQLRRFSELEVESLTLCTIVVHRHDEARGGVTVKLQPGPDTRWPHLEWALGIATRASDPGRLAETLLHSRVELSPGARFDLSYRRGGEGEEPWVPEGGQIRVELPFVSRLEIGAAEAASLAEFDGTRTLEDHVLELRDQGRLPSGLAPVDFARSFLPFILSGTVLTDAYPLK